MTKRGVNDDGLRAHADGVATRRSRRRRWLPGRGQFAGTISRTAMSWGAVAGIFSTHQPRG